jgi:enoyl-CoA hydratase/carnithine racemase
MIDEYKAAGIPPSDVFPQSFNLADVLYWIKAEPEFGKQAVFLDERDETDASLLARLVRIELLLDAVWRAPVRTAALGSGRIVGAGADLFCACDRRWIDPQASLCFPGAGFGIVLGSRRLAARVGEGRALQWVSSATLIDATLALASGLATDTPGAASAGAAVLPEALLQAPAVEPATYAALRAALRMPDAGADADLAALVRSAARPGLRQRIEAYRAASLAARQSASAAPARTGSTTR